MNKFQLPERVVCVYFGTLTKNAFCKLVLECPKATSRSVKIDWPCCSEYIAQFTRVSVSERPAWPADNFNQLRIITTIFA